MFGTPLEAVAESDSARGDTDSARVERLERQVRRQPDRSDLRYELARAYERTRQYEKALGHYRTLVERYPGNPDYRYGVSRVLYYRGNLRAALTQIHRARKQAPDYAGLYRHEINVLQALGRTERARTLAQTARRRFPKQDFEVPPTAPEWRVRWESSFDELSGNRDSWSSHGVQLTKQFRSVDVSAGGARVSRFDRTADQTTLRVDGKPGGRWRPFVSYKTASSVDFLADEHLRGGFSYALKNNLNVRFAAETRDYGDTEIRGVQPGVTLYRPWGFVGYTFYGSRLKLSTDREAEAHHVFAQWTLSEGLETRVAMTRGESVEAVSSTRVQRSDLESYGVTMKLRLGEQSHLSVGFEYADLEKFYLRRGWSLSLTHVF